MITTIRKYKRAVLEQLSKFTQSGEKDYVLSRYVVTEEFEGRKYLYNVLTTELIDVTEYEEEKDRKTLITHYFLVDREFDEFTVGSFIKQDQYLRLTKEPLRLSNYTIMTTLDCNARCFYCYEKNFHTKEPMSDEVAKDVAEYIIKNSGGKQISLSWFGGEPLVNPKAIDIITSILRKNNISFVSNITTNGYLLDTFSMYEMLGKWRLNTLQITLDGDDPIYSQTKKYISNDTEALSSVLRNIKNLSDQGVFIRIRLNATLTNKESLISVIDKLVALDLKTENIGMYCNCLFDTDDLVFSDEQRGKLIEIEDEINRYIMDKGFIWEKQFTNYSADFCMADSGRGIVISPKGQLSCCEHFSEDMGTAIGTIYDDKINPENFYWWKSYINIEMCKTCALYPVCRMNAHCPNFGPCTDVTVNRYHNFLHLSIRQIIKNYLNDDFGLIRLEVI